MSKRSIPTAVLTQARRLAESVRQGDGAAGGVPVPPPPPRPARTPLERAKREKLLAALRRLHPMD